ncbi:hypothetical protein [uncultured Erythrobacter sp.]|uniref:hypothetical protein n=1 Tax=uncultured Erythrobacter sp. TaxID=263913 RepID=UPI00260C1A61|nr:hypothetical protein [uncultured Erythrobacter sp.]
MPKIELSSIPGLETAQALFGAVSERVQAATYDDSIVAVMVYIYDTSPPPPPPPGIF